MNTVREQIDQPEDAAPVDMLAQLFEAHGWPCEFVGEDEICGEIQGSWTTYQLRCIWRAEDRVLQLLCLPEVRVPDAKRRVAYELLALVNEQLWLGHFDIWSQGGMLLYRHGLMLGEDGLLSLPMAQLAVETAVAECDRFYPAFQFVLWGDKNPRDALDAALVDPAGEGLRLAMGFDNMLIVGCGNMAGAMLDGWLSAGADPARFTVLDPHARERREGIRWLDAPPEGERFDALLIGVKPQVLGEVAPLVAPLAGSGTVLLSILAGAELAVLAERFPDAGGWVRIMPNLAAALGKSPLALASRGLDEARRADVTVLMEPLGTPEWFQEEAFDAVTALAGSGPAFVYRFIDALAKAGAELGLPAQKAARLALATVEGASALAAASPHEPGELARRVASPGGTTQAGLDALDKDDALARLIAATLRAARDRSAEMAREARQRG